MDAVKVVDCPLCGDPVRLIPDGRGAWNAQVNHTVGGFSCAFVGVTRDGFDLLYSR